MVNYEIAIYYSDGVGYCFDFLIPNTEGNTVGGYGFGGKTIEQTTGSIISNLQTRTPNNKPIRIGTKNECSTWTLSPADRIATNQELTTLIDKLKAARPNIEFIF